MTRRLRVEWPDHRPFETRGGSPVRILAVSDELDPALDHPRNRDNLGPLDLVVGCGDLASDYLNFLGDAFQVHVVRVLGNHDRPALDEVTGLTAPEPIAGRVVESCPLPVLGLSWPGRPPRRSEREAWRQALRIGLVEALRRRPLIVASHIAPRGAGDVAGDLYHVGSPAYRWLLGRLRPPLWLHGHTPLAGVREWQLSCGPTAVVNVTGAVLVEIVPPGAG